MTHASWVEINLSALDANLAWWRRLIHRDDPAGAAPARLCAVVKANAYSLGAATIARRLIDRGVDMLAVYSPAQAEDLLTQGVIAPTLILMPLRDFAWSEPLRQAAAAGHLHLTIHDTEQLVLVDRFGQSLGQRLPIHLHLDTGMSRAGISAHDLAALAPRLAHMPGIRLAGISTHLATADDNPDFAAQQMDRLDRAIEEHRAHWPADLIVHAAATCGALRSRRYHHSMVRIGLGLYGFGPELLGQSTGPANLSDTQPGALEPVVRWLAHLVHVQRYAKGSAVGYGCTHHLQRDSLLGLIPVGYADGYPLSLSNRASVRLPSLDGQTAAHAPVLGRINMDQIVVDLTDVPAALAHVGCVCELYSDDPASACAIPNLARLAGSSCYELLCRLSSRLPRCYVGSQIGGRFRLSHPANTPAPVPIVTRN